MDVTLDWLIGFIEGEGSFSYRRSVPTFSLCQKDSLDTLYEIQRFLGFGMVYPNCYRGMDVYQARRMNDCLTLISLFDGKLRLRKKIKQFTEWKEICLQKVESMRGRWWSLKEDEETKTMLKAGIRYPEIAKAVKHSIRAIEERNIKTWRIFPLRRSEKSWFPVEDEKAKQMLYEGVKYAEIANALSRSYNSIKWRNIHVWKVINQPLVANGVN